MFSSWQTRSKICFLQGYFFAEFTILYAYTGAQKLAYSVCIYYNMSLSQNIDERTKSGREFQSSCGLWNFLSDLGMKKWVDFVNPTTALSWTAGFG